MSRRHASRPALARLAPPPAPLRHVSLPALVLFASLASPALAARVSGVVVDRSGKPVEYANVRVVSTTLGGMTDEQGRFTLELPDGPAVLEVAQLGYQRTRVPLVAGAALAPLRVTLGDEPLPIAEVNVSASSFGKAGKSEGAVLRRMDVYMTPGGAADIFQSLRALPGINAPNEGAALFVRGGDPRETEIRLDGAQIGHPYHYESASGGLFSILDAYMLKSAFFSSGGFPSKYGGAMSGVLDIETQDPMNLKTVGVGANFAGGSFSSTWALVPDRLSLLTTASQSWPAVLFRLYGSAREYEEAPQSFNVADKLLWRYSSTGRLSLLHIGSKERLGVHANSLNIEDVYHSRAGNGFAALQWTDVAWRKVSLRGQVSGQRYLNRWDYAAFRQKFLEEDAQAGLDAVWHHGDRSDLAFGGLLRARASRIEGDAAADSTDLASGAPARVYGTDVRTREPALYLEEKLRVLGPLYATFGGRADYASGPHA